MAFSTSAITHWPAVKDMESPTSLSGSKYFYMNHMGAFRQGVLLSLYCSMHIPLTSDMILPTRSKSNLHIEHAGTQGRMGNLTLQG